MLLRIEEHNIDARSLQKVITVLQQGGIIIYPTDAVYTMGCDLKNINALERLCALKGIGLKQSQFSIVCESLSHLSEYAAGIPTATFRLLNKYLPGPYTFILPAHKNISKYFGHTRTEIGYRIPNHEIPQAIVNKLGNPIISATIKTDDNIVEYSPDPEEIYQMYHDKVDLIIDGGWCNIYPTTIIDCVTTPTLVRQGLGDWN